MESSCLLLKIAQLYFHKAYYLKGQILLLSEMSGGLILGTKRGPFDKLWRAKLKCFVYNMLI